MNQDTQSLIALLQRLAAYQHADVSIAEEAADLIRKPAYAQDAAKAVDEEREACAKVVESMEDSYSDARLDPALITAAIRSRPLTMNPQRKIIQIAATAVAGEADILYSLCDDGTLWWTHPLWVGKDDGWRKVRDIPQEEIPNA